MLLLFPGSLFCFNRPVESREEKEPATKFPIIALANKINQIPKSLLCENAGGFLLSISLEDPI